MIGSFEQMSSHPSDVTLKFSLWAQEKRTSFNWAEAGSNHNLSRKNGLLDLATKRHQSASVLPKASASSKVISGLKVSLRKGVVLSA